MAEWWTYSLSDFLLFSARVYFRLLELHNAGAWPLQLLFAASCILGLYLLASGSRLAARIAPFFLGGVWVWVGWSFFWQRYATINWAASYVAPLFALEGLLLVAAGARRGWLALGETTSASRNLKLAALALCLVGYPLIAPVVGRPWLAAESFGTMPDPTAAATLLFLALSTSPLRWLLMVVPAAWCIISGATLWTMGESDFFVAPLCAIGAIGLARLPHRR